MVKPASTTEYAYDSTDRRTVVIEDGVMTRTLWSGADEVGQYASAGGLVRRFIPDGSGTEALESVSYRAVNRLRKTWRSRGFDVDPFLEAFQQPCTACGRFAGPAGDALEKGVLKQNPEENRTIEWE